MVFTSSFIEFPHGLVNLGKGQASQVWHGKTLFIEDIIYQGILTGSEFEFSSLALVRWQVSYFEKPHDWGPPVVFGHTSAHMDAQLIFHTRFSGVDYGKSVLCHILVVGR